MDVLIIRCTHLEHLDLVCKVVGSVYQGSRITILTHQHAVKSIGGKYSIIPYMELGDFSIFKKPLYPRFDIVVIPFNNERGGGYLNVILFAFGIRAPVRMACNPYGQLIRLGYGYLLKRLLYALFAMSFAIIFTVISFIPIIFFVVLGIRIKGCKFEKE